MPIHREQDDNPHGTNRSRLLVPVAVVAVLVIVVLLHVLGVLGPSVHG